MSASLIRITSGLITDPAHIGDFPTSHDTVSAIVASILQRAQTATGFTERVACRRDLLEIEMMAAEAGDLVNAWLEPR